MLISKIRVLKVPTNGIYIYFMALMIVLSHSVYVYLSQRIVVNLIYVVLTFLPVIYVAQKGFKLSMKRYTLMTLFPLVIICVLYMIKSVNSSELTSYVCRYLIYLPFAAVMFAELINQNKGIAIFDALSKIMYVIACISMFFWIFGTIIHLIPPSGSMWVEWGGAFRTMYYGLYIEVPAFIASELLPISVYRNVGIFCEAPAYAFFLGISFSYDVIIKRDRDKIKWFVFAITILSTGTSTGLLSLMYVIIAEYWLRTEKTTLNNIISRIVIIVLAMIGFYYIQRFVFSDSKMYSVLLRQQDYVNGINAWLASPILGYGYMNDGIAFTAGFSNAITQLLIGGGLVLLGIYFVSFLISVEYGIRRNKRFLFWIILAILLFSISIVGYTYVSLTVVALGYSLLFAWKRKTKYGEF